MLFIDANDLKSENEDGERKDRKVICNICSTMGEKFYIHKVNMKFNPQANVYNCPQCNTKVSGKVIENIIYFQNRDFIYEPEKIKKEQGVIVGFGGLNEYGEKPEVDIISLEDEYQEPQ